jgi:integrase/recombinase XerC
MPENVLSENTLDALVPGFLLHIEVELHFAKESVIKYRDCLKQIRRILGNLEVTRIGKPEVLSLKADLMRRELSISRQVTVLLVLRKFLIYVSEELVLPALPPEAILIPRRPRKEVGYLTPDEVELFIAQIKMNTGEGHVNLSGLRFRALIELLLGSAMRISEALSLDRGQIDFKNAEAKIIGKGSKERVVFFTDRALRWVQEYLKYRTDDNQALFVTNDFERRLKRPDIWRPFLRSRKQAGIEKRVTPHMLRHTAATQLLFNGCPVGHIKEILGHERLETTCRYYLGLDHRAAKAAHARFLIYSPNQQR